MWIDTNFACHFIRHTPLVYGFTNKEHTFIKIGRTISLRDRLNHFNANHTEPWGISFLIPLLDEEDAIKLEREIKTELHNAGLGLSGRNRNTEIFHVYEETIDVLHPYIRGYWCDFYTDEITDFYDEEVTNA